MFLVNKPIAIFLKKIFFVFLFFILINIFFISLAHAESITKNFTVVSGEDSTTGTITAFSQSDINALSLVDQNRIRNNSDTWPIATNYDENKYLEFVFNTDLPNEANIESVVITNNFRRSGALTATKLEVWDGGSFVDEEIYKCQNTTTDCEEEVDITSYINTADLVNNIKIRFLAYRDEGGNTKTSHDFIGLKVVYNNEEGGSGTGEYTEITEDITEDTVWTKENSPYVILNDLYINSGITLRIEEGVVVKIEHGSLLFNGNLEVYGTELEPVYFTSFLDDSVGGDTNGDGSNSSPSELGWGSITFIGNTSNLILNNVKMKYLDSELFFLNNSNIISSGLDLESGIILDESNGSFTNLKTSRFIIYSNSSAEINKSVISNQNEKTKSESMINVYLDSSLVLKNTEVLNYSENTDHPIGIFAHGHMTIENSIFQNKYICSGNKSFINTYNYSTLNISNSLINSSCDGLEVFENSKLDANGVSIISSNNGILLYSEVEANINKMKVSGTENAISIYNNFFETVNITNSEIVNNRIGFFIYNSTINANYNNISGNTENAVEAHNMLDQDFTNNYWGDASGPYNELLNTSGKGDSFFGEIFFEPWLLEWPYKEECKENCFSNIMFFPGIEGSRLYGELLECGDDISGNLCGEKEFWVSNDSSYHEKLFLDHFGKSINDVYTKNDTEKLEGESREDGIIDEILGINIYESFISDLEKWKNEEKIINDYALIPYDWRLSLEDIIKNGKVEGENISYTKEQDISESFILNKLRELQSNSKSDKVTLIAHSTGGLVVKTLVDKLRENNDPLYEKIDKIIFVSVPQVGTPEATIALLHGVPLGKGFILPTDRSRQMSENMPTVYNLAPSEEYFNTVDTTLNPIITFENDPLLKDKIDRYGIYINTALELKDFVLGGDNREKPEIENTRKPNIGNTYLYEKAENIHKMLDSWKPNENTKVIEVGGWGEETKAGLDYVVKKKFLGEKYISYKPRVVIDGDSTVLLPSAFWMENGENVEEWLVNLGEYNKPLFNINREHKDILEINNLRDFIKSQISNVDFIDEENIVIRKSNINLISDEPRLHFTLHSPLYLGIMDSEGRYTGIDPITKDVKNEIPDVYFEQIGDVQFISIKLGIPYTLKLQGYEEGSFTLDVDKQVGDQIVESTSFEGIKSNINTFASLDIIPEFDIGKVQLKIDYDNDQKIDDVFPKSQEERHTVYGSYIIPKAIAKEVEGEVKGITINNTENINESENKINIKNDGKVLSTNKNEETFNGKESESETEPVLLKDNNKEKDSNLILYVVLLISLIAGLLIIMIKES